MKHYLFCIFLSASMLLSAAPKEDGAYYLQWAERLADAQMVHDPQLCMSDGAKAPKWDYTQCLLAKAMLLAYQATGREDYLRYVQAFADYFIGEDGSIKTYKKSDYNIDRVNGGCFLYLMNDLQPERRFELAIELLRSQLEEQPRTQAGGFWHKKVYPWQMWLDGLYMGEPFYCRYAFEHSDVAAFDDIQLQFETIDRHTYDKRSGLNYHGWDESKSQRWADPITGCSPHFWGRSMGWYVMAMVDVLDNMPQDHPGYASIQGMLERSAKNLLRYQDKRTHLWYQVLDMQQDAGNYQESTCSAIFCYAFAKAANRGYLPKKYKNEAKKIFDGLVAHKLRDNGSSWDLIDCCAVAGLGGNPYRDGSYRYYISEPIRSNDAKGVGPLILAAIELAK